MRLALAPLLTGACCLMASVASAAPVYRVTLVHSPSDYEIYPTTINNRGHVAGLLQTYLQDDRLFIFRRGVVQDLGTFESSALADPQMNDKDEIVSSTWTGAFVWRRGVVHDLSSLGVTSAQDINNRGQVTGATTSSHAYRLTNGNLEDLGTLSATSQGLAINSRGVVVGVTDSPDNPLPHAALFKNGAVLEIGPPYMESYADAINDRGQIALTSYETFWGEARIYANGVLGRTFWSGAAWDINNRGEMVGYEVHHDFPGPGPGGAMVYTEGAVHPVEDLIDNADPLKGDAWLGYATGINDRGQIVAMGALRSAGYPMSHLDFFILTPVSLPADCLEKRLEQLRASGSNGELMKTLARARSQLDGATQPVACTTMRKLKADLKMVSVGTVPNNSLAKEMVEETDEVSSALGCQ